MSRMISGSVVLPPDAAEVVAKRVLVEVRDVSILDAPSLLMASTELANVRLFPSARLAFSLEAPDVERSKSLGLRAHVDITGDLRLSPGDYLSKTSNPVPAVGMAADLVIHVYRI